MKQRRRIAALAVCVLMSADAALGQTPASPAPGAQETAPSDTDWREKNENLKGAATAPLDDLNLRRVDIPAILLDAAQTPYDLTGLTTCKTIGAAVLRLDEVVGPDLDAPAVTDSRTLAEKSEVMAGQQAVSAVKGAATSLIPYRGLVRKISGAERHQHEVEVAVQAGQSRRAFLKGIGMSRNCAVPAAPAGFVPVKKPAAKPKTR